MSEARPPVVEQEPNPAPEPARKPSRRGMFHDPMVRGMAILAAGIVILFLATVLGALFTGVIGEPTGPRTYQEKQLAVSAAALSTRAKDPAAWGDHIAALIDAGQYSNAERAIKKGRATTNDTATADFTLSEARLNRAQGKHKEAIQLGERALKQIQAAYDAAIKEDGDAGTLAKSDGLPENYYATVLVIGYSYVDLDQPKDAITYFDMYIARYGTAADILIDRGNAKAKLKDIEGAEQDFRTALRFIPDSPEALEGLSKIGASGE